MLFLVLVLYDELLNQGVLDQYSWRVAVCPLNSLFCEFGLSISGQGIAAGYMPFI